MINWIIRLIMISSRGFCSTDVQRRSDRRTTKRLSVARGDFGTYPEQAEVADLLHPCGRRPDAAVALHACAGQVAQRTVHRIHRGERVIGGRHGEHIEPEARGASERLRGEMSGRSRDSPRAPMFTAATVRLCRES